MVSVTKIQLKNFVEKYLQKINESISNFAPKNRDIFPQFWLFPYRIIGTISTVHGVSIEFVRKSKRPVIKVRKTTRRIEEAVLPKTTGTGLMFRVSGEHNDIVGGTFDVGDRGRFVEVMEGADVKLINNRFLSVFKNKVLSKETDCLWIFGSNRTEKWTLGIAEKYASIDFNSRVAMIIESLKFETLQDKLASRNTTFQAINTRLLEFRQLINKDVKEEVLKQFLKDNKELLKLSFLAKTIIPEYPLGETYQVDFVAECYDSQYLLIELEKSALKLFTKGGDPTHQLTHAVRQVGDFQTWIQDNIAYVRQGAKIKLPKISPLPKTIVVIGRKHTLDEGEKKRLKKINENPNLEVITFDDLIERVELILENLKP